MIHIPRYTLILKLFGGRKLKTSKMEQQRAEEVRQQVLLIKEFISYIDLLEKGGAIHSTAERLREYYRLKITKIETNLQGTGVLLSSH